MENHVLESSVVCKHATFRVTINNACCTTKLIILKEKEINIQLKLINYWPGNEYTAQKLHSLKFLKCKTNYEISLRSVMTMQILLFKGNVKRIV